MSSFLLWYLIITILGWLTFPLAHRLFPALEDKGFTLARAAGLLIWAYIFWILASLGIAQNDLGGILLALAILIGLSAWAIGNRKSEIQKFLKSNLSLILTTEVLFFFAFAFLAFVRSANPELASTEKPMELAFISGIMRSPAFPPQDPWLSGYAISYYYFGYVMTAMLAMVTHVPSSMAHNLMTSLIFGLGAIGSYGIVYNLLSVIARSNSSGSEASQNQATKRSVIVNSLLAPLFLLLVSNFEGLLEILHRRGFFWVKDPATGQLSSSFWTWLNMNELSQSPAIPFEWMPDRYLWWWRASRVIQDYDMVGGFREVIDEFPFFSFLLGDLHPHVLAIPFGLLVIAVALNLFLGGARGEIKLWRSLPGVRLHINVESFIFAALVIGGLSFLNTWDTLVAAALVVASYIFWRASEAGWRRERYEDLVLLGFPLGIVSILLYLPFYLSFSSSAGGILPNQMYITRGVYLWIMWGTLFIPIFAYLLYLFGTQRLAAASDSKLSDSKIVPNWKLGFSFGLGSAFVLFFFSWFFSLLVSLAGAIFEQNIIDAFLTSQNMTVGEFFIATSLRRLEYIGSLITLLAILIPAIAFLFPKQITVDDKPGGIVRRPPSAVGFTLLLLIFGILLILVPEFIYLRDAFGYRINTVFKFYYQAWILLSLVASFATAVLLEKLRGFKDIAFRILIALVILAGLLYPALSLLTKTNNFNPSNGFTLDDFDRIKRENPGEAAAILWLQSAPDGIIAEVVGDSYSGYARISKYTGMQTVLGWPGHEGQWRGNYEIQGARREDIAKLYTTARWDEAQTIIDKYNIRYIYIGDLERTSVRVNEEKFQTHLNLVFQQGSTVIYEAP